MNYDSLICSNSFEYQVLSMPDRWCEFLYIGKFRSISYVLGFFLCKEWRRLWKCCWVQLQGEMSEVMKRSRKQWRKRVFESLWEKESVCLWISFALHIVPPEGFPCIQQFVDHLKCHSQLKNKIVHIHTLARTDLQIWLWII